MPASIAALYRYPIKGFSPEPLTEARLAPGEAFPGDRLFAVENGPSGFDPAAPAFIPKMKFTVLAAMASVAKVATRYDDATRMVAASTPGRPRIEAALDTVEGRVAFADWLAPVLADEGLRPLKVIDGAGHRFTDHPKGHVSVLNLASVRDLEARLGVPVDPLRFRANVHVEGWPAWAENDWAGQRLCLGPAEASVFAPITRCAATMVDPATAERDLDIPAALHRLYGHLLCGVYVHVTGGGVIAAGDLVTPKPSGGGD